MIKKIFQNIALGFWGIINNRKLSFKLKLILFADDIRFLFLLMIAILFKRVKKIKKVKIYSFGYVVHFSNYITFYYIFNEIFCKSIYQPFNINNFLDVGANIGLATLWFKFFNPKLKVLAFEPEKENYSYLLKNIRENHLKNISTFRVALSNKNGTAKFYKINDDIQNLDSGLSLNQDFEYESYQVKTSKLSGFIKEDVDLLKMDIEGGEYFVFDDLFQKDKIKFIDKLIFEAHYFDKQQRKKLKNILKNLKRTGKIKQLENSGITTVYSYSKKNLN